MTAGSRKTVREVAAALPVAGYLSCRDYLRAVYTLVKRRVESYSWLLFAADLGFSATNVVRLMVTGHRPLTMKAAGKMAQALGLTGADRKYFLALAEYTRERLPHKRDELFRSLMEYKTRSAPEELTPEQAEYFSEWYHPVIREMAGLPQFNGDPEWIRQRLAFPLRLEEVKKSLELLTRLKMLRFDTDKGTYVRTTGMVKTDAEIDSMAVVRYHQKMIEMGREAITRLPEDRRDIRAVTVTIPESLLPQLKGKLEEWIMEVAAMEDEEAPGDTVVQVNMQMYPFTR